MATFTNQASLTYQGQVLNSNIVTGELQETLTATKTAVTDNYGTDNNLTYVISINNNGATAYNNLTVTDDLGAYSFTGTGGTTTLVPMTYRQGTIRYYINGELQTPPAVTPGPPMVVTGISVPAGENAMLIYEAELNEFAPMTAGSTITNTATVNGAGVPAPIAVEETVTADGNTVLTITKSMNPMTITDDETVTYTFVIQNTGNNALTVEDGAAVSDTFDPILTGVTVTLNGAALPNTDYTYNQATGVFATNAGVITAPAATFTQDPTTGAWTTTPGVAVLTVTGTV